MRSAAAHSALKERSSAPRQWLPGSPITSGRWKIAGAAELELPKQFLLTLVEGPQHEEQASSNQRALVDPDQSLRLRRQGEAKDVDDRQADNRSAAAST
jgi:hypothetical protein